MDGTGWAWGGGGLRVVGHRMDPGRFELPPYASPSRSGPHGQMLTGSEPPCSVTPGRPTLGLSLLKPTTAQRDAIWMSGPRSRCRFLGCFGASRRFPACDRPQSKSLYGRGRIMESPGGLPQFYASKPPERFYLRAYLLQHAPPPYTRGQRRSVGATHSLLVVEEEYISAL